MNVDIPSSLCLNVLENKLGNKVKCYSIVCFRCSTHKNSGFFHTSEGCVSSLVLLRVTLVLCGACGGARFVSFSQLPVVPAGSWRSECIVPSDA